MAKGQSTDLPCLYKAAKTPRPRDAHTDLHNTHVQPPLHAAGEPPPLSNLLHLAAGQQSISSHLAAGQQFVNSKAVTMIYGEHAAQM